MDWYEPSHDHDIDRRPRSLVVAAGLWLFGIVATCAAIWLVFYRVGDSPDRDATMYLAAHAVANVFALFAVIGIMRRTHHALRFAAIASCLWGAISIGIIINSISRAILVRGMNWQSLYWGNVLAVSMPSIQLLAAGGFAWCGSRLGTRFVEQPHHQQSSGTTTSDES